MPNELEVDLATRFVQGDLDAFETIFKQFEAEVYRWILRIVRDPAGAEDVVVEAFWRAHRGRASGPGSGRLRPTPRAIPSARRVTGHRAIRPARRLPRCRAPIPASP